MATPELEGMVGYLYEMGLLKRLPRAGWLVAGIEGADPARTALLCLFHDTQESRTGDVPLVGKRDVVTAPNPQVTADQVAGFPEAIGEAVRALVDDYERQGSAEARLARDADRLECLIQAREYQAQGHDVQPWVESAAAALRSETARRFADAFRQARPDQWWRSFAGQLRPQEGREQTAR